MAEHFEMLLVVEVLVCCCCTRETLEVPGVDLLATSAGDAGLWAVPAVTAALAPEGLLCGDNEVHGHL